MMPQPPQWVLDEVARRQGVAEEAFATVAEACSTVGMTKQEYCALFVERFPPITWSSSTTGDF